MKKEITITDVARLAGVSAATVSRVMNGNKTVAAAIQHRVRSAISATGYAPEALDRVVIDDSAGIWQATRHLLMLGHRRIALITGTRAAANGRDRAEGFAQAYVDLGVAPQLAIMCVGGFSAEFGFEQAS